MYVWKHITAIAVAFWDLVSKVVWRRSLQVSPCSYKREVAEKYCNFISFLKLVKAFPKEDNSSCPCVISISFLVALGFMFTCSRQRGLFTNDAATSSSCACLWHHTRLKTLISICQPIPSVGHSFPGAALAVVSLRNRNYSGETATGKRMKVCCGNVCGSGLKLRAICHYVVSSARRRKFVTV